MALKRHTKVPRLNWTETVEAQGFYYHTSGDSPYWDESAYFSFEQEDIEILEKATNELHQICLQAVDHVVRNGLYSQFRIHEWFIPYIEESWRKREPDLYGRFDLVYFNPKFPPKMLEYNGDTPSLLLESSVIQYEWLKDCFPEAGQFNQLHSALVERWKQIAEEIPLLKEQTLYFACAPGEGEDIGNTDYLRYTAEEAGITSVLTTLDQTGWLTETQQFMQMSNKQVIPALFKLYPWEWLVYETPEKSRVPMNTPVFEPAWKMLLSNKAILPILWEMFPNHPNLLPCYPVPDPLMSRYVSKPLLSREGANIEIHTPTGGLVEASEGPYGEEGHIYQAYYPLPQYDGNNALIGSWIVGGKSAGICMREDHSLITKNYSRFLPHLIL